MFNYISELLFLTSIYFRLSKWYSIMRQENILRGADFNHVKWQIWTIELWHWKLPPQQIMRDFWN